MIMTYGALIPEDIEVLEAVLAEFRGKPMRFLEVGVYAGNTSRGIRDWCADNGTTLEYWGVESGTLCVPTSPFPEANFVVGESWEVFMQVPEQLDVAFIDGNHTFNGVVLDALHYGRKVKPGGFMLFHDCAPQIQYKLQEPNRNYPEHPFFHNAVNDALSALGLTRHVGATSYVGIDQDFTGWTLWMEKFHPQSEFGGMRAYKRA